MQTKTMSWKYFHKLFEPLRGLVKRPAVHLLALILGFAVAACYGQAPRHAAPQATAQSKPSMSDREACWALKSQLPVTGAVSLRIHQVRFNSDGIALELGDRNFKTEEIAYTDIVDVQNSENRRFKGIDLLPGN